MVYISASLIPGNLVEKKLQVGEHKTFYGSMCLPCFVHNLLVSQDVKFLLGKEEEHVQNRNIGITQITRRTAVCEIFWERISVQCNVVARKKRYF